MSETTQPILLEIIDNLAPENLHREVWAKCNEPNWYFGNRSTDDQSNRPFWKMNLTSVDVIDRLWQHVKPRCEALVAASLQVERQYANGHTYGLGGRPHFDDDRLGTYTLLYYPMLLWKDGEEFVYSLLKSIQLLKKWNIEKNKFELDVLVHNI